MKTIHSIQIIFLFLSLLATSCVDNTFTDNRHEIEEGLPTYVQLKFKALENSSVIRHAQDPAYENQVNNLYVLVFNGSGDVHFRGYYEPGTGLYYKDNSTKSSGSVGFNTTSLGGATIVGIANLTTETTATAYNITKATLDGIKDLSELKNLVMKVKSPSIYRYALFMMTGYAKDDSGNTTIDIPSQEDGTPLECTLKLERTDAKITFNVQTENIHSDWTDFSFRPTKWTVKQVPQQSLLLPSDDNTDADGDDCIYFNSLAYEFEEIFRSDDTNALYTGGSFVFYTPENKKQPIQLIDQTDTTVEGKKKAYVQRGSSEGTYANGDKIFTNANPHSTYVEITGLLSYFNKDKQLIYANIKLIIHLGYNNSDANDYNTLRNHHYTYNIKIRGVDDIKVEVGGGEENPGYEGDVVENFDDSYEFDSHYDRRLITLNRSGFTNIGEVYWGINTPFSKGVHRVGDEIGSKMRDYRWIKFAVNTEYGVNADTYVKYPGDQNYNDPYPLSGMVEGTDYDAPSPYYTQNGRDYPNARLRDVNQLMTFLKEEAVNNSSNIFDENGNVAITVFVDENVYVRDPNDPQGIQDLTLWKRMAETDDRQLYIIVEDAQYSDDEQSSVIKARYSFRQRSIRTIFNIYNENLEKAWGVESKMETDRLSANGVGNGSSTSNGRLNTIKCILGNNYATNKGVKWTDVLGVDGPYSLNGNKTAVRACLLRNRDLNGDNIIDPNEIRWYLAAIDQLTDIYIGENALDEQSRLYPVNKADRENQVRWHYTSSSQGSGSAWIIWSEEGASRGNAEGSKDDNNNTDTLFSYRCIRNLGVLVEHPEDEPENLVKITKEAGDSYLIDLSKMHVNALRPSPEILPLPVHNEQSLNNLPYVKFRVHPNVFPTPAYNNMWNSENWQFFQTYTGYPTGYRIPNQRELLIMSTRMPADAWKTFYSNNQNIKPFYMCQTSFSLNGKSPYTSERDGFYWDSSSGNFILQNYRTEKGYVRPIQDVQ